MTSSSDPVPAGPFTVGEISDRLGGEVEGGRDRQLVDVRSLADAAPEHLSFLSNRKYVRALKASRAGAVLIDRKTEAHGRTVIRLDDPYAAYALALALFHPLEWPEPRIDPLAFIAPDAVVADSTIEAFVWIGPGAEVGHGSWIEAGAYVGAGVKLGESCRLMPGSVIRSGTTLGDRVWVNPGSVIGGEGFGFAPRREGHLKIPQVGRTVIESDVEIGSNSCVDRASMGETVVRRGAKLDNFVQIAHGVEIGEGALLAAYAGVAGSSRIGKGTMMAARSGVSDHVTVGEGGRFAARASVLSSTEAGEQLAGTPAIEHRRWLRASKIFSDLPKLLKRVRSLEKKVKELEDELEATRK